MSWIERFSLVMRSQISFLRESIEDPERMLQQLVIDMEEELGAVRKSVAGAIADEILLRRQSVQTRAEVQQWLDRATQALARQDETKARAALEQKGLSEARADQLEQEHAQQCVQTEKLRRAVVDLEDKIRQARQKRTLLMARMARARSTQRVNAALDRAEGTSAFAEFGRLEAQVERSEAMAEAYDQLNGRDPDATELEREFAERDRKSRLEQELEDLKARVQTS